MRFWLAASAAFLIPSTALAESACSTRETVLNTLARKYAEQPEAYGLTLQGGLVEVVTSEGGATWSIIVTTPRGITCLVAAGENWRLQEKLSLDPET